MDSSPNQVRALRCTEQMLAQAGDVADDPHILLFAIRLPFDLPVPDRTHIALRKTPSEADPPWIELTVRKVVVEPSAAALKPYERGLEVVLGEAEADTREGKVPQTWVVVGTMNALFDDEPADAAHDEARS
jgi:hypothetical protein